MFKSNVFRAIRNGQLSKDAFVAQLNKYETDKIELQRNAIKFGPELFKSKLKEIEMSISFCEIFLSKYDDIAKVPSVTSR